MNFFNRILNNFQQRSINKSIFLKTGLKLQNGSFNIDLTASTIIDKELCFKLCSPLSSVILKRGSYLAQAQYKAYIIKDGKKIPVEKSNNIIDLLNNPNKLQSKISFISMLNKEISLYGICVIYPERKTIGYKDFNALNILENRFITWPTNYINQSNFDSTVINYNDLTTTNKYELKDLILIYDTQNNGVLGVSRVDNIVEPINNVIKSIKGHGTILSRPNGIGIIGKKHNASVVFDSFTPEETEALENIDSETYNLDFGGRSHQVIDGEATYVSLLEDYKKFGFSEALSDNERQICTQFNMPPEVYFGGGTTYENKSQTVIDYIVNEIKPYADNIIKCISTFADKNSKIIYESDFSHLPMFQEDKNQHSQAVKNYAESYVKLKDAGVKDDILIKILERI